MERERDTKRSLSGLGMKVDRLAGIRWCGQPSRVTSEYYKNGLVVTLLSSLISAKRNSFCGSFVWASRGLRISTGSRASSSSNGTVVRYLTPLTSSASHPPQAGCRLRVKPSGPAVGLGPASAARISAVGSALGDWVVLTNSEVAL